MIFEKTKLQDVVLIRLNQLEDERGFFARSFCQKEFADQGLQSNFSQCNISFNLKRGTLRGLHYQRAPYEETKVVYCYRGAIWDVVVDLRPDSPTYRQWAAFELNEENRHMLYIPTGCAHGLQTLRDNTEVFYWMGNTFEPESATGIYWNDPALAIPWPIVPPILSDKDKALPRLT